MLLCTIRMTQTGNMHTDAPLPGILSPFDRTAAFVDFTVRKALSIHRALFAVYVTMCRTHPNTAFFFCLFRDERFPPCCSRRRAKVGPDDRRVLIPPLAFASPSLFFGTPPLFSGRLLTIEARVTRESTDGSATRSTTRTHATARSFILPDDASDEVKKARLLIDATILIV